MRKCSVLLISILLILCAKDDKSSIKEKIENSKGNEYVINAVYEWYNRYNKNEIEQLWEEKNKKYGQVLLVEYGYPENKKYNYCFLKEKDTSFYLLTDSISEKSIPVKEIKKISRIQDKFCCDCGFAIFTCRRNDKIVIRIAYGLNKEMDVLEKLMN